MMLGKYLAISSFLHSFSKPVTESHLHRGKKSFDSCAVSWCHRENVMGEGLDLQDPVAACATMEDVLTTGQCKIHCKMISLGIILSLCCCKNKTTCNRVCFSFA